MSREASIKSTLDTAGTFLMWSLFVILAGLASLALYDHAIAEAERLDRVHLDGMASGAAICVKEPS